MEALTINSLATVAFKTRTKTCATFWIVIFKANEIVG